MSAAIFVNSTLAKANPWPFPFFELLGGEYSFDLETSEPITPQELGITFTHCMGANGKGGVTIAWRKTSFTRNARMVEVAVAYCSPADTYTKKIGKNAAMRNFLEGKTVLVPARTYKSDEFIPDNLRYMFWSSLSD